jgi:hypothetical protein
MVEAWCIGFDPESNLIGVATKDKKINFWRQIQKEETYSLQVMACSHFAKIGGF